jgi:hypothetical protein
MDLDSTHLVQHRTSPEIRWLPDLAMRRRYWPYHFIAEMVAREWVTNPRMRLPHSLSTAAFHALHANFRHLLTIHELANLPIDYMYPGALLPGVVAGGDGPSDALHQQSIYAALSIYSFVMMIDMRVDVSAVLGLIAYDVDAGG